MSTILLNKEVSMKETLPNQAQGHVRPTRTLEIGLTVNDERLKQLVTVLASNFRARSKLFDYEVVPTHFEEYIRWSVSAVYKVKVDEPVPRWLKIPSFFTCLLSNGEVLGQGYRIVVGDIHTDGTIPNTKPEWWFEFETAWQAVGVSLERIGQTQLPTNFLKADIEIIDGECVLTGTVGLTVNDLLVRSLIDVMEKDKAQVDSLIGMRSLIYYTVDDLLRDQFSSCIINLVSQSEE